jgi:ATPase subunit of ABC transporter with duplicated ATPase domains
MQRATPSIFINHLSYSIANDQPLFRDLSLTFDRQKIGLVGKNGLGKSTLLKLITGKLLPDSGTIQVIGALAYCSQELIFDTQQTIIDICDANNKLFNQFNLSHLASNRRIATLSGGETTKLFLAHCFDSSADFIFLDEPTNNLDASSRELLYRAVQQWQGGLLIASHDRALLNLMDHIMELTSLGIRSYGGNYDHYMEQKNLLQTAAERQLFDAKKSLKKTQRSIQATHEQREQKQSYGRKRFLSGKVDRITANSLRGRSEKTQSRHTKQNASLVKNIGEQLQMAKSKIEIYNVIDVSLPKTFVPNSKVVIDIEDLTFCYTANSHPIVKHFNLTIMGPERIALQGNNGSGKTTLVKLILGELKAVRGKIYKGIEQISYLDQNINLLNPELSILENFKQFNPGINETDARLYLAQFLFRNTTALKLVGGLSSGEKLRAQLACVLMSKQPPQLLILDEPTNHLDLDSITSIESALKNYQGAMLIISHDQKFLENIHITRTLYAPFNH